MNRPDEFDYYVRRAEAARHMADAARDSTARRSHDEMARRYRAICDRISPRQPVN